MKKIALTMSTALLVGGLAACNTTDDNALNDRNDNTARPIGYYTNDDNNDGTRGWFGFNGNVANDGRHRGNDGTDVKRGENRKSSPFMNANDQDNNPNEGPLTDMLDQDDQDNFRNNPQNYNRRGDMQNRSNRQDHVGYYDGTDEHLARRITDRVEDIDNVRDARTIVYGNQVVIGVDSNDNNDQNVERDVRRSIQDFAQNRNVTVVTDEDMFNRIRTVDTNLQDGNGIEEVQSDINAILNDLGDAIQRPFQDNR